jgi:outer membrane protein assembly factor BamB
MKTKYLALIGLMLVLSVLLGGCATGLAPSSWPAMTTDANNVYIAGGPYVYAVNLQTGVEAWRFPDKASTANPFYAAPVLTPDGQLIVGGFDKKLYGINLQTHQSTWQFTGAKDRWIAGVLVTDNMIYAANADYNLYALNFKGELQWTFAADQALWGTPASDGTNVYFGTLGRNVYAVNASTGKKVWQQKVDGAVLGTPTLGEGGTLYVGTFGGSVYTLSTSDGKTLKQETVSSRIWSGPVRDGTDLFVGDESGNFYYFPLSGSGQPWTQALNGSILSSPLVSGNNLVIGTDAGNVYFISHSGQDVRPIAVSGKVHSTPVTAGNLILVATVEGDNLMIALDQTGAVKWSYKPAK